MQGNEQFLTTDSTFNWLFLQFQSIASAVVQVCFADPPSRAQWNKRHCGVLCFIKDNYKRSYFLRVYCLDLQTTVWEQELYSNFEYRAPRPYFHTFEGDVSHLFASFVRFSSSVALRECRPVVWVWILLTKMKQSSFLLLSKKICVTKQRDEVVRI